MNYKYHKISSKFWTDEKVISWDNESYKNNVSLDFLEKKLKNGATRLNWEEIFKLMNGEGDVQ